MFRLWYDCFLDRRRLGRCLEDRLSRIRYQRGWFRKWLRINGELTLTFTHRLKRRRRSIRTMG